MRVSKIFCHFLFLILLSSVSSAQTEIYAARLPHFVLNDPLGEAYTSSSFSSHGVIVVVTAPILSNKKEQEGWDELLTDEARRRPVHLVFLEDMGPSFFKGVARKRLKKEYRPDSEPLLLIDPKGEVRQSLGVPRKKTVVLAYDRKAKLVHAEEGEPSPEGARRIWQVLGK